jgi:hypothetical protein
MTSYLNDTTIWKSYFMIKCMWNFILMKCIVARCFDLYTIQIMFCLKNDSNSTVWRVRLIVENIRMIDGAVLNGARELVGV